MAINRSSYYYEEAGEREEDLHLKRLIDEEYLRHPFYGSRSMVTRMRELGFAVCRKRVQGLMREMGLEAIYPKPRTTIPGYFEAKFPYLLRGLKIDRPDQAWCADITYVPLREGYGYCVAVMDWWSRCVLSWRISKREFDEISLEERRSSG